MSMGRSKGKATAPKTSGRPASSWPDAVDRFAAHLDAAERSPLTIRNYRDDLISFASWYQETYKEAPGPGWLGATELREWKAHLSEGRKQMPATVNRALAAMRSFLRWAESAGLAGAVPTPRSIRQERPRPRWLNRSEELALVRA